LSVRDAACGRGVFIPPKGWRRYNEQQRRTWRNRVARELRFRKFCEAHPHLPRSAESTYAAYGEHDAGWLKEHELTATKTVMWAARRSLCERREIPRRGRPKGSGRREWHPRAEEHFDRLFKTESRPDASDVLQDLRALARAEGFTAPTIHMVRRKIAETPWGELVLMREGVRACEAKCVPKGVRPRERVRGWWSLDCRVEDVWIKAPDGRHGLRAHRAACSGVYIPFAAKWSDLRFGLTENKDLIAASIRGAVRNDGFPRIAQSDNGWAYDFLSADDADGMPGLFRQFGVTVVKAIPYAGWQKPIEPAWMGMKKRLDRRVRSYCAGSIPERPEPLAKWAKDHVYELPTLGDLNRWAREVREELNATPRPALGGLTPNIFMERYWGTWRRPPAEVVAIYLCPLVGKRKCGRDGVRWANYLYRPEPEELVRVQNRTVQLRKDPDREDVLILCDERGEPLCDAYCDVLFGLHRETARETRRRQARYRTAIKRAVPARAFLSEAKTTQLLRVNREFRQAEEAAVRANLGDAPESEIRLMQPESPEAARRIVAKREKRDTGLAARRSARPRKASAAASNTAQEGFELLSRGQIEGAVGERDERTIDASDLYADVAIESSVEQENAGLGEYYQGAAG